VRPATEIASQVRTGRITALEVVTTALEAAEASHADLNAFTLIDQSGALHRAEGIDRLVAEGHDPGPLAGVPIAIKDIIDDAGLPNTAGSSFPTSLATHSAPVVRRLGAAGAVIIGRTGLHEFAFGFTSENPWFGPVRNPWDTATSPGGSSGGSAAAVAAGVVPIAIGTDTGGSVRVPAAMCGIVGLKVTHGRIPLTGVFPLVESLDTVGPLARSIDDLAVAYLAMAGDDPSDPWSQVRPVQRPGNREMSSVRFGVVRQWLEPPHTHEVRDGLGQFIDRCESAGAVIEELDVPELAPPDEVPRAIGPEIMAVHGERYAEHPERYGEDVALRIEQSSEATARDLLTAQRWGMQARAVIDRLATDGFDALVCPTVGAMHKTIGVDTIPIDGFHVFHRDVLSRFTSPINRIGIPSLSAPVSDTPHQGVSVQLIGPMWSEAHLLSVGAALENADVISTRTPPISFGHEKPQR
jgi:aspartyl-tRNA(Asn)/glutamyl-tRNA(Gln) amidotransferase subunit A